MCYPEYALGKKQLTDAKASQATFAMKCESLARDCDSLLPTPVFPTNRGSCVGCSGWRLVIGRRLAVQQQPFRDDYESHAESSIDGPSAAPAFLCRLT